MFKIVLYTMNPESGFFEKSASQPEPFPVLGMPFKFQRQRVWQPEIKCNATECLQISEKKILTGLQPIGRGTWFAGDLLTWNKGKSAKSLLVIYTSLANDIVLIALFRNFYKVSYAMRKSFAEPMIPEIWARYRLFLKNKNAPQSSL